MEKPNSFTTFASLLPLLLLLSASLLVLCGEDAAGLKTYIVHVRTPAGTVFSTSDAREEWHRSFLPPTAASSAAPRMVYSYGNVMSGFSARLTSQELKAMEEKEGFLRAHPEGTYTLKTTRTPQFLGLQGDVGYVKGSSFGEGVIIAMLDTGVVPDHPSFSGDGMPPPPAKWKGRCDFNASLCNNKIIGARTFLQAAIGPKRRPWTPDPPFDEDGHGTHTSSTAAGQLVSGAQVLGNARGTASGMAPRAHLAIYKVCNEVGCSESDILAAMDAAVEEGVDVLSMSLGGGSMPFCDDGVSIGAFGAMERGVFVSGAAGNEGPSSRTLSNEAPWVLTVAASTMDRSIRVTVRLGNGVELNGESLYQPRDFASTQLPLVFAGASGKHDASCGDGSLDGLDVKGKVVLCEQGGTLDSIDKGLTVKKAGGAAMILMNQEADGFSILADAHVLPASNIGYQDGCLVKRYINSSASPTASLVFKGTVLGTSPAPAITSFSSRGPSIAGPGTLKPDITGPGVDVLAAWPFPVDPTSTGGITAGASHFNIISGTSMSTPHLSGIAALLKSAHPDWSPAAIKSAIMTTADALDRSGRPITDERRRTAHLFAIGAGHVNPTKAVDPGLVYDLDATDYARYLCGLGYTDDDVEAVTRRITSCSSMGSVAPGDLNYPSISIRLSPSNTSATVKRTVKNVGEPNSVYMAEVRFPEEVAVSVDPRTLRFSAVGQEKSFTVTARARGAHRDGEVKEGQLVWSSSPSKYVVRSPISVTFALY